MVISLIIQFKAYYFIFFKLTYIRIIFFPSTKPTFSTGWRPAGFSDDDRQRIGSDLIEGDSTASQHGLEQGSILSQGKIERNVARVGVGKEGVEVDAEHRARALKGGDNGPHGVDDAALEDCVLDGVGVSQNNGAEGNSHLKNVAELLFTE